MENDLPKLQDIEGPACPVCGERMVRIHIECHDKSGWMHGWSCTCDDGYDFDPGHVEEQLEQEDTAAALNATWVLLLRLRELKRTRGGRLWAIAATQAEQLYAWISYVMTTVDTEEAR